MAEQGQLQKKGWAEAQGKQHEGGLGRCEDHHRFQHKTRAVGGQRRGLMNGITSTSSTSPCLPQPRPHNRPPPSPLHTPCPNTPSSSPISTQSLFISSPQTRSEIVWTSYCILKQWVKKIPEVNLCLQQHAASVSSMLLWLQLHYFLPLYALYFWFHPLTLCKGKKVNHRPHVQWEAQTQ